MTKTLTEQWREGTLERGYYYYKTKVGAKVIGYQCFGLKFPYDYNHNTIDSAKKVLSPVPSYDKVKEMSQKIERLEFDNEALEMAHNEGKEINAELLSKNEQLEKKLEIATKALEEIPDLLGNDDDYGALCCATDALQEMEGVK